jgi:hypothetical protein
MILKIIGIWLKFCDFTEIPKKGKFAKRIYFLLLPITLIIDTLCFVWCWRVIILQQLLSKEPALKFFDDNEFGYRWWKLYKTDIIEPDSFLDKLSIDELKIQVQREMTQSILKVIRDNTNFDIEEYVSLICATTIDPETKIKIYWCTLQYYRYHIVRKNWFLFPIWIILILIIWYSSLHLNLQHLNIK